MKKYEYTKDLEKEIEEFEKEKERVRNIVGKIGGKKLSVYERYINTIFIVVVLSVFFIGGIFHKISFALSIEIGVLLTSLKIAWMIHQQEKVNHFQFWMLTSLEFRMNEISKKIKKMEKDSKIEAVS